MGTNTQAIAVQKPKGKVQNLRDLLEQSKNQIILALPRHMDADKMMRVAITALQKTPALLDCDPLSVIGSVIEASQLGLYPDGILGDAYLVPYNGKCQLQPGYRGYINLARRSGQVSWIASELVFDCDKFSVKLGDERKLVHEPDYDNEERGSFDEKGELKNLRGCYAVVKFKDGTTDFEYMPKAQLNQIRNMSKAKNSKFSPWNTPEARPEMYRKIPIRRLAKRLPLSPEFQKVAVLDEYVDAGVGPNMGDVIDHASETAKVATELKAQQLIEKHAHVLEENTTPTEEPENPQTAPEAVTVQAPAPVVEDKPLTTEEAEQAIGRIASRPARQRGRGYSSHEQSADLTGIFQSQPSREPGEEG